MPRKKNSVWRWLASLIAVAAGTIIATHSSPVMAQAPFGGGFAAPSPFGGGFGTPASSQITNPPVSPYLNLTQPGINPGIAYQTLVQPQLQLGSTVAAQQQQIGELRNTTLIGPQGRAQLTAVGLQTGHPTTFLNTLEYFPGFKPIRR